MFKFLKFSSFLFLLFSVNSLHAVEKSINDYVVTQQQWSVPKKAESILTIPALHAVMNVLSKQNGKNLLVRYPGGDVGVLWATELKAWLVALGLASTRIELQSGSANENELWLFINE